MKTRASLLVVVTLGMIIGVATPTNASGRSTAKALLTGDCADGTQAETLDNDDCRVMITVTPKNRQVSATLQIAYDEKHPEWEDLDSGTTRGGRFILAISPYDEWGDWMNNVVLYRVVIAKTPGVVIAKQKVYKIEFVSGAFATGDRDAKSEEDAAFNEEMDRAQADNQKNIQAQQPNTQLQSDKSLQQQQDQSRPKFNKAKVFGKACSRLGISDARCGWLVAAKTPERAYSILGEFAEKWCAIVSESTDSCDVVLPDVFPPLNG